MSEEQTKSLGEIAYDAYLKALKQPGYSIGGFPVRCMKWEGLTEHQQNAWQQAAEAIIISVGRDTVLSIANRVKPLPQPDVTVEEQT